MKDKILYLTFHAYMLHGVTHEGTEYVKCLSLIKMPRLFNNEDKV